VRIRGRTWSVLVGGDSEEQVGKDCVGACLINERKIFILEKLWSGPVDVLRDTIWHELVHAMTALAYSTTPTFAPSWADADELCAEMISDAIVETIKSLPGWMYE
jgi:hypothetical protein